MGKEKGGEASFLTPPPDLRQSATPPSIVAAAAIASLRIDLPESRRSGSPDPATGWLAVVR